MKGKKQNQKGIIKLSEYFKKLEKGDRVAIKRDLGVNASFPKRINGKTGIVEGIRGKAYIVRIKEYTKEKSFIIPPIHLKKLKKIKKIKK